MVTTDNNSLKWFFAQYSDNPALHQLQKRLDSTESNSAADRDELIALYHSAILIIEDLIWDGALDDPKIDHYQKLFQELEQLIAAQGNGTGDSRHKFVITIPVADRPQHLQSCLNSLLTLCQKFNYGGKHHGKYTKVMAIIADDSREQDNIAQNREIAAHFSSKGLETLYFGQDEQLKQLERLSSSDLKRLKSVLGDIDRTRFYHKGASIMRNIVYLKLKGLQQSEEERLLFYFIDSDQEFRIKVDSAAGDQDIYAISFLHKLDQIFSESDLSILTGKVVGDPPVSPSVMAGNFLEDVIAFLHQMAAVTPQSTCQFHNRERPRVDDASYHDMADLFGFKPALDSYHYNCTLPNSHNHRACFSDFANKLNRFFDGEHPTRKTYYENQELLSSIAAARTIYTGNYIFRPSALDYFIPFATLKLRMAGPVLGRIIKSELGDKFVSANLPMLHKRTVHESGRSEFRPGISREPDCIDLSDEFERQFFGDVMLFTMEQLTAEGYPKREFLESTISESVNSIESSLHTKYQSKQRQIIRKISLLKGIFNDPGNWWNRTPGIERSIEHFNQFINNIDHNFGDNARAYKLIGSNSNRERRLHEIVAAITQYGDVRASWKAVVTN